MFNLSKIARRLALYFGGLLVIFALIVGVAFYQQFKSQSIALKQKEMQATALRMAEVVGDNIDRQEHFHGSFIAHARMARYLDNVSQEAVWIVDRERNLFMKDSPVPPRQSYDKLPKVVKDKIEQCFMGRKFSSEEYSERWKGLVLTVGAPVVDRLSRVRAVVLLHAPVEGLKDGVYNGLKIMLLSLSIAFGLGLAISGVMARLFTQPLAKMKNIAEELGRENYAARCDIIQDDEVGELAATLDTLALRLEDAKKARERLDTMRKQFIANVTHELRTPLTVVLANLEALKLGVIEEKSEVAAAYESMEKEGLFAKEMISDLLELSKLQNADFPLEKEEFNFVDIVNSAWDAAKKLAREKQMEITFASDVEVLPFVGDARRLRQMLLIFITNAIKFSEPKSTIEIGLKDRNLTITDHGCGMSREAVEHAFESFYKSHDERNKEGSGLGLAIARSIADRHGLVLTLTSAEEIGTTVRIRI